MRKTALITFLFASATMFAQQNAQIYVDMSQKGNDIPKSMYGIFFEEINHAGDGGLYAEMLQNRGFEEHVYPGGMTYNAATGRVVAPHSKNYYGLDYVDSWVGWDTENLKWRGWKINANGCTMEKDIIIPESPLHENTPNALQVKISNAGDAAKVNIDNTGYWGVAYKKNATYKLRFYLNTSDYNGKVKAIMCTAGGSSVGEKEFDVVNNGEWTEYTATLTSSQTLNDGLFRLQFYGNGSVEIDYVSLFPTDTYKGRENGLRRDIAEALEQIKPAFMRWPGGCIVEGITLENRVKWKETLGDPMTRRGEFSLWGYRSTYGLGYHEFLQFCEDMGMDGMFVGNVGMSCSIRNGDFVDPTDETALMPFRQDIEDAIEYAIGTDPNNEWVAKRIEAGHPEPFPLKYVELGNENGTARYSKRYGFFYDYLKKKYPQLTFINTLTWWDNGLFGDYKKTDMLDVHWYVTPDEFYNTATLFENAYRGKNGQQDYTIYAGEYAVNNGVGHGNMDAALAEAAFIGNMERNSDFVTMASYAPLLTNVNQPNWHCNLIWYDNHQVMGRASYYVQTMYAQNRPDWNVKTRLFSNGQKLISAGKVGIGTWATQAKFRNIRITNNDGNETLYEADFMNQLNDWTEASGKWAVNDNGEYVQSANGTPCLSFINACAFRNSTLELEAMKTGGAEGFLIAFGADTTNVNTHYRINLGGWGNTAAAVEKVVNGGGSVAGDKVSYSLKNNQWYKIRIEMREGNGIYCYVDGKLLLTYKTGDILDGRLQAYAGYDENASEMVVKVVNGKSEPMTSHIRLNAEGINPSGRVITLKADALTDENSMNNPKKIIPVESDFNGFASEFDYTFQPNSFTIFRIKTDKTVSTTIDIPQFQYDYTPIPLAEAALKRANAISLLQALVEKANSYMVEGYTGTTALNSAVEIAQMKLQENNPLTRDLEETANTLQTAINKYFDGLMNTDYEQTAKLKNPNFYSMSTDGWIGNKPALEHNVGEFFNTTFNSYQTLKDLENGYYLIYVQGFYRNGGQPEAYAAHQNGTEALNASLYANTTTVPIRSLYDFETGAGYNGQYCDNRAQAENAFKKSRETYANYLVVEVKNGQIKLGVKKTKEVTNDWTCFNNFRLFYIPVETNTAINQIEVKNLRESKGIYDICGRRITDSYDYKVYAMLPKGIYIIDGKKIIK